MVAYIKFILISFVVLYSATGFAKAVRISGAAIFKSNSVYRGVLTWSRPSFFIGPGIIFYEKIHVRGPSFGYTHCKRRDRYKLDVKLSTFNDRKPLFDLSSDEENFRNSRSSTFDFGVDTAYKFGFRNLFVVGAELSYEFKEYNAFYMYPYIKLPVAPFVSLKLGVSVGAKETNKYLYGETAKSGMGFYSAALNGFMPLFKGALICGLEYTSVQQEENRESYLVGGKPDNLNLALRYVVKFN